VKSSLQQSLQMCNYNYNIINYHFHCKVCTVHRVFFNYRFVKSGLSQENLKAYVPMIIAETEEYFARWNKPKGVEDIHEAMAELVILTASRCLLGDDVRSRMDESCTHIIDI
jgi:sterol 14alpha-demethylase